MKAVVLAAGQGSRLRPLTDDLPKTLLTVDGDRTILDASLANLAAHDVRDIALITGFASHRIDAIKSELEARHEVSLTLIHNEKGTTWNNAYSLWVATDFMDDDTLLVNSDTLHPPIVEQRLFDAAETEACGILLAIDSAKSLGEEEMKTHVEGGVMTRIHKSLEPATAFGEYIGVSLIRGGAVAELKDALQATWERDPQLYYEDGYQELADRGFEIGVAEIGEVEWIEVDSHEDLERAREIACRS